MKLGCASSNGLYNWPDDGNQFNNGCQAIWDTDCRTVKFYATGDFATDYPFQTAFNPPAPTTLTELFQTVQFVTEFTRGWDTMFITTFPFCRPNNAWWRTGPTNAQLLAMYTEIKNAAIHILTTYNDTGLTVCFQNWEGDWNWADSFDPTLSAGREMVTYYSAFLAMRQKAVSDARRETAHKNITVLNVLECNRVLDAKTNPNRRRIVNDIAGRFTPDMISFSAYEASDGVPGWGSQSAFDALVTTQLTQAWAIIDNAFHGVPKVMGEVGYPENQIVAEFPGLTVGAMIQTVVTVCKSLGVQYLLWWQVFDNEASIPYTYRGYWFIKPDGSRSLAGTKFAALGPVV